MFITNNGSKQFMDDASKQQLDNDAQSLAEPIASPNGKAIASTSISHDGEQELIVGQQQLVIDDQLSLLNLSRVITISGVQRRRQKKAYPSGNAKVPEKGIHHDSR